MANNSDTSTPTPRPCRTADHDRPYDTVSVPIWFKSSGMAAIAAAANTTPARLPSNPSASAWSRYTARIWRLVPPTHFITAMLLIFCCTNTRVTLDTAMPPSTTMTRPTRLR